MTSKFRGARPDATRRGGGPHAGARAGVKFLFFSRSCAEPAPAGPPAGVTYNKKSRKWQAVINHNGRVRRKLGPDVGARPWLGLV